MERASVAALALALLLTVTGCASPTSAPTPAPAATAVADEDRFEEMVSVAADRELSVVCVGEGEPAVVYLHGMIQPQDEASWAHAPELRSRLRDETRYCEYERTNVGESSSAEGPIPLEQTLADLDAVLDAAGVDSPAVLLGGSYGGLIAYTYAGTRPDRVAGVVLLDPTLPWERDLEVYAPAEWALTTESWQESAEKIDVFTAFDVAQAALPTIPAVPGTIFVTEDLWVPEGDGAETFRQAVRQQQADLIAHFAPGKTITVDAPHAMVPVVPDEIADAVLAIVGSGR